MPPLEAAIAGNKVIGYTGGAGKEYWEEPIFTKINNGDIFNFCQKILDSLEERNFINISKNQRKRIVKKYSTFLQQKGIRLFLGKIS